VAQASRRAIESATLRWSAATAAKPEDPLGAVIAFHRVDSDNRGSGGVAGGEIRICRADVLGDHQLSDEAG
jgi:hypothetical protein